MEEMPTGIGCRRYFLRLCHRMGIFADQRTCNWKSTAQVHSRCCGVYSVAEARHTQWCAFHPYEELTPEHFAEAMDYRRKMRTLAIEAKIKQESDEHIAQVRYDYKDALLHEQEQVCAWQEDRDVTVQAYWPQETESEAQAAFSKASGCERGSTGVKRPRDADAHADVVKRPARAVRFWWTYNLWKVCRDAREVDLYHYLVESPSLEERLDGVRRAA